MSIRAAKRLSAVFASVLAGTSVVISSATFSVAEEECLSAPRLGTPDGGHWYYRVDRATKRHCWYRREGTEAVSQLRTPSLAKRRVPPSEGVQRSLADARAELPAQTSIERPNGGSSPFPAIQPESQQASAGSQQTTAVAAGRAEQPSGSVIAFRWPDPSDLASRYPPQPNAERSTTNLQAGSAVSATPAQTAATEPWGMLQELRRSKPLQMSVVAGAMLLAGIAATAFLRRRHAHRFGKLRVRRDTIDEVTDDDRIVLSDYPDLGAPRTRPRFARSMDWTGPANERIAEFYSQLSKPPA
jgi:hypothetical protein